MSPAGRPEYEPNEKDREQVEKWAGVGISQDDMAFMLDICKNTLRKHYTKELKAGIIKANATVGGRLYSMTKDIPAAAIFWSKTRMGWRESMPQNEEKKSRQINFIRDKDRKSQVIEQEKKKNGTED